MSDTMTYIALGDSYTLGEQVPQEQSFPFQLRRLLGLQGLDMADPVVIAQTGWTTDELAASIRERQVSGPFSLVTLLIGVNNQYRGRSLENYAEELSALIDTAISYTDGHPERVYLLSIPDWGTTPFAEGKNRDTIARQIDQFNAKKKELAQKAGTHFLDITDSTRAHGHLPEYLVEDGLHPNGKEYALWAQRLAEVIRKNRKSRN